MSTAVTTLPDTDVTAPIAADVTAGLQQTRAIVVLDANGYRLAGERVVGLKDLQAKTCEFFDGTKDKPGPQKLAYAAWKALTDKRAELLQPIQAEITRLTTAMDTWQQAEDRRLQEEADRQARALAEQQQAVALEAAAALERQGLQDEAAAVVAEAIVAPAPVLVAAPAAPKVAGLTRRQPIWRARIVDASKLPREYLMPNDAAIQAMAKTTKGSVAIPGVEMYEDRSGVLG